MSFIAAGALIGGGMAVGAAGSVLGASSANRASRQARTNDAKQRADTQRRMGYAQFGVGDYQDFVTANNDITGRQRMGLRPRATRQEQADAQGRFYNKYKSVEEVQAEANPKFLADLEANRENERRTTGRLDMLATQSENAGQDISEQEIARIQRDSDRRLTNLNRTTSAQLGLLGVSSLPANQTAANTRMAGEEEDDAILRVRQQSLDRFQRARQARIALLTGRTGFEGDLDRQLAGTRRNIALDPAQRRLGLFSEGQYGPGPVIQGAGQSGLGAGLASVGSGMTTLGGLLAFSGGGAGGGQYGTPSPGNPGLPPNGQIGMLPPSAGPWR